MAIHDQKGKGSFRGFVGKPYKDPAFSCHLLPTFPSRFETFHLFFYVMPLSHGKMTDGNMVYERTNVVRMHDCFYVSDDVFRECLTSIPIYGGGS